MAMVYRPQRLLTLEYMGIETVAALPHNFRDLRAIAVNWARLPDHVHFGLRAPVQFISPFAARAIQGDFIYIDSEETYHLVTDGLRNGLKVEIVTDGPSPTMHDGALVPYGHFQPPATEMEANFKLEMWPHHFIESNFMLVSEDERNATLMDNGMPVEGEFFGILRFVHAPGVHRMDFEGSRLSEKYMGVNPSRLPIHPRTLRSVDALVRPMRARSRYTFSVPRSTLVELMVRFSPLWTPAFSWPVPDRSDMGNQPTNYEFRIQLHPGGLVEHPSTKDTTTCVYLETTPDAVFMESRRPYVDTRTSFALPFADFVDHMKHVLEHLISNVPTRSAFITDILNATANHPFVAYRFMESRRVRAAIDLSLAGDADVFVWTRLFFFV